MRPSISGSCGKACRPPRRARVRALAARGLAVGAGRPGRRAALLVCGLRLIAGCGGVTEATGGDRVVVDFDALPPEAGDGTVGRGCTYSEDGFTLQNLQCGGGGEFRSIHAPNYRYSASVSLFNNVQLGVTRLTRAGGGSFGILSIDLDGLNGSATVVPPGGLRPYPEPALFTFVGTRPDGATVTATFATDHVFPGRQTFVFSDRFDRVTQVTWTQDNGYPRPSQQFDNIVLVPDR